MKPYKPLAIPSSEITPQCLFDAKKSACSATEQQTPLKNASRYNNFYEFDTRIFKP